MHLREVELENFRQFERECFVFPERVSVLIGDNGSGKSSLLTALAVAAGAVLLELSAEAARSIAPSDVRSRAFRIGDSLTLEPQVPCRVSAKADLDGETLQWRRSLSGVGGRTDRVDARSARDYGAALAANVRDGGTRALPLVVSYSTARLWLQKKDRPKAEARWAGPSSRLAGYQDALDPASSQKVFLTWMRSRTLVGLQRGQVPADLAAVRRAVTAAMPGEWSDVVYDLDLDELVAVRTLGDREEDSLPFSLLSDGQRTMLALVADLAYRCAVLNPQFREDAPRLTRGVVLIDEIDLHLHPRWQQTVLDDLARAFEQLQFVTTTHSPFVVQGRGPGEVINLSAPEVSEPGGEVNRPEPDDFRVKGLEDVAGEALKVELPRFSRERRRMYEVAERYYALLDGARPSSAAEVESLRGELDVLAAAHGDNPAHHAFLELQRRRAGID